jgi:hypothetical protein
MSPTLMLDLFWAWLNYCFELRVVKSGLPLFNEPIPLSMRFIAVPTGLATTGYGVMSIL